MRVASSRSLSAPRRRHELAQVADRRAARRARAGAARAGTGRGPSSRAWTRRPARRGRRASRAGSRTSCWRAAASSAAARAPAASATFSWPIARRRRVGVADEVGEVVAALGDGGDRARGVDDEVGQRALVLGELVDEPARGREERVEVLGRLGRLRALALVLRGEALDDALQVLARVRVERVEDLVEVDDVGGRADRRASRRRRAPSPSWARASARCSGWRCPTARSGGSRPGCPRAAARRAPRSRPARGPGCRRSA